VYRSKSGLFLVVPGDRRADFVFESLYLVAVFLEYDFVFVKLCLNSKGKNEKKDFL